MTITKSTKTVVNGSFITTVETYEMSPDFVQLIKRILEGLGRKLDYEAPK